MAADEFNQNPLIPQIPVKLTCILAGFMSDDFSGIIKAYLDTEEINAYFDAATKEVTVGWEDEHHLIVEFAKPMPHWEMEPQNACGLTGASNAVSKFEAFISNRIFRLTLDSPLTHPKDIDPASLSEDIKVTFNSVLGYKEGILMKAKNKSGDYMPRAGQDHGECNDAPTWDIDNIEWKHFDSVGKENRRVGNYDTDIEICDVPIDVEWDACQKGIIYRANYVLAGTLDPWLSFDNDEDTEWTEGEADYTWQWISSDLGVGFHSWERNHLFIPRYVLMLNCGVCDGESDWVEKGPVWFGEMHVDHTPPVLADDVTGEPFKFVMGSELTTYIEGLLGELDGQGDVYTHEGQTGNLNFLMSYYEYMVGQYVDNSVVYGVLVAKDGFQGSDKDPGQFLSRQLAIDTVDCNDTLICSDYFVNDLFFLDAGDPAADEWADDQGPWYNWPNFGCQRVPADGFASGEYSVWILGIPLEYYATYKKIKVRIKDDVDNWRRFEVYDYEDSELWIEPPPDNADYTRCETVVFQANIEPVALGGLLPYVEWIPVDGEGEPRAPAGQDPENGYNSIILSGDPPWFGDEFSICIRDNDFWVKAYVMGCGEEYSDTKHVTDLMGMGVTYTHPAEGTYRRYDWDEDFEVGEGWGDGNTLFKQYVNYPDGEQFEGSEVVIIYEVAPFSPGTVITFHPLLDPPTDIYGNVEPTNPLWDIYNPPDEINSNSDYDEAYLTIDGVAEDLPYPYTIPDLPPIILGGPHYILDPPVLPELVLHNVSPYGGDNYQIRIEVTVVVNEEPCESYAEASPVINVWRRAFVLQYAMENPVGDPFAPNASGVSGAFDDGFLEVSVVNPDSPILTYNMPIILTSYNGILAYCDKEDEYDVEFVPFHDPWNEYHTIDYCIHLQGVDRFDHYPPEDILGMTWLDPEPPDLGGCIHRHGLVSIYACQENVDDWHSFDDILERISIHEAGRNIGLTWSCASWGECVMTQWAGHPFFREKDYLCVDCIAAVRESNNSFLKSECYQ